MTADEQEMLCDAFTAEGRAACRSGDSIKSCPYGYTMLMQRCWWLAGYRDAERGMV